MAYYIERAINSNLEDTAIPNLFITDFLPDAPDGDFVKVYIYAYMCCRQGIALTHTELADRLGLELSKVLAAWAYFSGRRIVRLPGKSGPDDAHFDVEFVDVKGMLYSKEKGGDKSGAPKQNGAGSLSDPALEALFKNISVICGAPFTDGADARRVISWVEELGATPEIIEFAYKFCLEERGEKSAKYVEKIVKEWAGKGLRTVQDVREYRAKTNARSAIHKKLMEALGLRYVVITAAEEREFDMWIDDYGYTPERLLELAGLTKGVSNKLRYLGGIIKKEREAAGLGVEAGTGKGGRAGKVSRSEYYRMKRAYNEESALARLEEVYKAAPEVKAVDDEIINLQNEIPKILTSGMADKESAMSRVSKEIAEMGEKRKSLLAKKGFSEDYTDIKYGCEKCHDTGLLENGPSCDCYTL